MNTMNIRLLTTAFCLNGALWANAGNATALRLPHSITEVPDSLYDESEMEDTVGKTRHNYAKEFNALKYVMENRYRRYGDKFTRRWDDHLFLEFGAGFIKDVGSGTSQLSPLNTVHVGVGKQFNCLHTARLGFGVGYGYYEGTQKTYARVNATADWLYSLTTYMDGYQPSRLFDLSTVFGVSYRYNINRGYLGKRGSKDIHAGLNMRFFTGPQGYITIEPYAGISSSRLVNKYGAFCGVNLNFIYYIHNNLSVEERMRFMRKRPEAVDSIMKPMSWRTPWFAELSGGVSLIRSAGNNSTRPGNTTTMSIGRWLSPVIALRLSGSFTSTTWQQTSETMGIANEEQRIRLGVPEQPAANKNNHNLNYDVRAEALFNPFGYSKGNSWDRPFGVYVLVGGGVGWINMVQEEMLKCKLTFYTAGLHFTYRLTDDLQAFFEPRYTNYNYKIPYRNVNRYKRFCDDVFSANLGLTVYTRGTSFRNPAPEYVHSRIPVSVGGGVGTNFVPSVSSSYGGVFNYNANVFTELHFTKIHSARISFEYMSLKGISPQTYHAVDLTHETSGYNAVGLFSHNYHRGFLSLAYLVNVTNLCSGYQGRRLFEAELFAGPTIMFALGATHKEDGDIILKADHQLKTSFVNYTAPLVGANGGVKLKLNAMPHLALTMTPQLFMLRLNPRMQGIGMSKLRAFETLDLGVQYDF